MRKYFPIRIGGSVIIPRMVSIAALWMLLFALIACQPMFESPPERTDERELSQEEQYKLREAKRTRDRLLDRAEDGNLDAQVRLGRTYCCGSPDVNLAKATFWLCQAAREQSPEALYSLAEIYAGHKEVENYPLALAYAELARVYEHPNGLNAKVRLMKQLSQSGISEGMALAESFPDIPCRIADIPPVSKKSSSRSPSPVSMPATMPEDGFTSSYRSGATIIAPQTESTINITPLEPLEAPDTQNQAAEEDAHYRTYPVQAESRKLPFPGNIIPEAGGAMASSVTPQLSDEAEAANNSPAHKSALPPPPPPPIDME